MQLLSGGHIGHWTRMRYSKVWAVQLLISPGHYIPPRRNNVSRRMPCLSSGCCDDSMCWYWHPPQTLKCEHLGVIRLSAAFTISTGVAHAVLFFSDFSATRTSSPGSTNGTNTVRSPACARPSPPYTSFSIDTINSSDILRTPFCPDLGGKCSAEFLMAR